MPAVNATYNVPDYIAGDTLAMEFTVRTTAGSVPAVDTATWRYAVAPITPRAVGAPLFTKTLGAGVQVMDAETGLVRVTVNEGDIPDAGNYHHELEMTLSGGESFTIMSGRIVAKGALLTNA